MKTTDVPMEFDPAKFERWIIQAADATISDEEMEALLLMWLAGGTKMDFPRDETLKRRLQGAIHAYCHILCITCEYRDQDVDLETSLGLLNKCRCGDPTRLPCAPHADKFTTLLVTAAADSRSWTRHTQQ